MCAGADHAARLAARGFPALAFDPATRGNDEPADVDAAVDRLAAFSADHLTAAG